MEEKPMRARRFFVTVGAAATALALVAACGGGGGGGQSSSDPIKVGLIADITGPAAQGEEYTTKGAQARIDALNDAGGIKGRKVELVVGDTASSPQGTLTAARKL